MNANFVDVFKWLCHSSSLSELETVATARVGHDDSGGLSYHLVPSEKEEEEHA